MSGTDAILTRLNTLNARTLEKKLSTENVAVLNPAVLGSVENLINTKAELTPTVGGGFTQPVTIGWRRLQLDKLFLGIPVVITDASAVTTRQLVPLINQMYGTSIGVDDIVNNALPSQANNAQVTITATADSLYLVGSFTLRFTKA